ncbi:siderophore-interacting protein [Rhodococcus sp. Q]|uniref:siderophore-interacting protein n=1 Tax=Rhodococcus sp. Q TaxID=2502252 RepID=UPI0010F94203|nr:siderophore-interacting protein [Rhodococcus sp. Q]
MARPTVALTVQRTEQLSQHLVRVYLGGPGFDDFTPNVFTDAYVKLDFGTDDEPLLRTYTVRRVDPENREIAVDFVVHGDEGVAGRWAASATPGDELRLRGPGGAYSPRVDADWHLLAGDESAIPAIAAALETLPVGARAQVFVEVAGPDDEVDLRTEADATITWIHRGGGAGEVGDDRAGDNAPLVSAVREAQWWSGQPHVFIHGEAQAVMHGLRPYIRKERGVAAAFASISGYWRRGRTEEGFREWKSDFAAADAAR